MLLNHNIRIVPREVTVSSISKITPVVKQKIDHRSSSCINRKSSAVEIPQFLDFYRSHHNSLSQLYYRTLKPDRLEWSFDIPLQLIYLYTFMFTIRRMLSNFYGTIAYIANTSRARNSIQTPTYQAGSYLIYFVFLHSYRHQPFTQYVTQPVRNTFNNNNNN